MGIGKDGEPTDAFQPGMELRAKYTLFGEGCRGSLSKQLISRLQLDSGKSPQVYAIGVKEVWELPEESAEKGHVVHTLGYPLKHENYGGGFIYNMGRMLSIGLVVGLDYRDPYLDPHQEFQRFKTHPFISSMLKNAKMAHYGAKAIPEGGYYTMPRSYFDGGLVTATVAWMRRQMETALPVPPPSCFNGPRGESDD